MIQGYAKLFRYRLAHKSRTGVDLSLDIHRFFSSSTPEPSYIMVKLMFASVFLILTTMSARAITTDTPPPPPLLFSISNQQTGYFLFNDGTEKAGQNVATISSDERDVSTTVRISMFIVLYAG